ncbi:helix-turn-helix domain-containing protein [Haloferula chungangensis]|uniref:Helix-turn-helix domain-containing protein n=1 Tax=Haloferula chungangensis TaxID=1048331 RepID=A0ABW2L598_9BACT
MQNAQRGVDAQDIERDDPRVAAESESSKSAEEAITPGVLSGRLEGNIESHGRSLSELYELEFTQLEAGETRMEVDFAATPSSIVYRECYDSGTFALGSLKEQKFALAIPVMERGTRWWGQEREGSLVPSSVSGELIDVRFAPGHRHMVMVLEHAKLQQALVKADFSDEAIRSIEFGREHRMMKFHDDSLRHLSGKLAETIDAAVRGRHMVSGEELDRLLLGAALAILDHGPAEGMTPGGKRQLVQRAIEVHDRMKIFPNVMTLCTELHVRPRTLQAAFQKSIGIGPHRFFQLRRLNEAKRRLEIGQVGESSVKEIALGLGFRELGRFAVRYRELFGELPSETLRKRGAVTIVGIAR